jgi:hypothetical protein
MKNKIKDMPKIQNHNKKQIKLAEIHVTEC